MGEVVPVFIGGAGRSGTTLVVDMLGLHSRLSPIYETEFILAIIDILAAERRGPSAQAVADVVAHMEEWTKLLPMRPHNKRPHERYHHGPHYVLFDRPFAQARTRELAKAIEAGQYRKGLRAFISALFAEHCRQDGKPRWLNKTPAYVHYLPNLLRLFPTLRFLHCIRDGRDVACSVVSRPWGPRTFEEAAVWWSGKVGPGVQFGREHPDQYLEVHYEKLLQQPAAELQRIFAWLGEPAEDQQILAQYREKGLPLDEGRMGGWKQSFSEQDRLTFSRLAGNMLQALGYDDA